MRQFWILTSLLAASLLAACSGVQNTADNRQLPADEPGKIVSVGGGSYIDISVEEMQAMLETKDFTFVNVHIPFEGNIPQTDLSIPYNEVEEHLDELPNDKNAKIVLYCRSDRMSEIAAVELVELGYTNIYNLDGGFAAWEASGLPVER